MKTKYICVAIGTDYRNPLFWRVKLGSLTNEKNGQRRWRVHITGYSYDRYVDCLSDAVVIARHLNIPFFHEIRHNKPITGIEKKLLQKNGIAV